MGISSFSLLSFLGFFVLISSISCEESKPKSEPRIINGEEARYGEFPHQVLLEFPRQLDDHEHICGGSIISKQHILTTASCFHTFGSNVNITAGVFDRFDADSNKEKQVIQKPTIREIFLHPCSDKNAEFEGKRKFNDIAIIQLTEPLTFNGLVSNIFIDEFDKAQEGKMTIAIGWGTTSINGRQNSGVLKKVKLQIELGQCKRPDGFLDFDQQSQICGHNENEYVCFGDSGGPLICDGPILCGLMSTLTSTSGQNCRGPSVYTRVYHYRKWIKDIIEETNLDSEEGCIGTRVAPHRTTSTPTTEEPISGNSDSLASSSVICSLLFVSVGIMRFF